jgi:hypothetical protein
LFPFFLFFFFFFKTLFDISSDFVWHYRIIHDFVLTCIFVCVRAQVHAPLVYIYIYIIYVIYHIC